jgi:hypothetical protein
MPSFSHHPGDFCIEIPKRRPRARPARRLTQVGHHHRAPPGPGAGHDGGQIVFEGTPADLVADRSTLTGEHLAAYVGT